MEGGRSLRLQVLRQLRAQYASLGDEAGMSACEREIDSLHQKESEEREAEQRRKEGAGEEAGGTAEGSAEGSAGEKAVESQRAESDAGARAHARGA